MTAVEQAPVRPAVPRDPPLVQGLTSACVGALLALLALPGPGALLVGVVAVQVLLGLAVLELLEAPGRRGAVLLTAAAVAAGGAVAVLGHGAVDGLGAVVALALVAALLHQLLRRPRTHVTASLTDTMLAVVLVTGAGCLVALRAETGGRPIVTAALLGAAAGLLAGRVADHVGPGVRLLAGSRGLTGLVAALVAGAVFGAAEGAAAHAPVLGCALLGLTAAGTAAAADLAAEQVLRGVAPRPGTLRQTATRHAATLLPYAVLGPVALVAGRLVLG